MTGSKIRNVVPATEEEARRVIERMEAEKCWARCLLAPNIVKFFHGNQACKFHWLPFADWDKELRNTSKEKCHLRHENTKCQRLLVESLGSDCCVFNKTKTPATELNYF